MRTFTLCWDGLQAGDKHIVESVARMQRVIEMSRIVRERHGKPLKMPLRSLTVVSADASFLDDLRGELRHYVLEEVCIAASHIQSCPRGGASSASRVLLNLRGYAHCCVSYPGSGAHNSQPSQDDFNTMLKSCHDPCAKCCSATAQFQALRPCGGSTGECSGAGLLRQA